jgi:hypothetical protein
MEEYPYVMWLKGRVGVDRSVSNNREQSVNEFEQRAKMP